MSPDSCLRPLEELAWLVPTISEIERKPQQQKSFDYQDQFGRCFSTSFAENIWYFFKYFQDLFSQLKDQTVVDIGAGCNSYGVRIAAAAKARRYIGVELHNHRGLEESIREENPQIPTTIVPEDMVTFLRRLPKNSVSIMAYGIDQAIIPCNTYAKETKTEIIRCLHPQGAFFTDYCSDLHLDPRYLSGKCSILYQYRLPDASPFP